MKRQSGDADSAAMIRAAMTERTAASGGAIGEAASR